MGLESHTVPTGSPELRGAATGSSFRPGKLMGAPGSIFPRPRAREGLSRLGLTRLKRVAQRGFNLRRSLQHGAAGEPRRQRRSFIAAAKRLAAGGAGTVGVGAGAGGATREASRAK